MVNAISDVNLHNYLLTGENFDMADGILDDCSWDDYYAKKETWQRLQAQREKQLEETKKRS